jgi:hypothetical protein
VVVVTLVVGVGSVAILVIQYFSDLQNLLLERSSEQFGVADVVVVLVADECAPSGD